MLNIIQIMLLLEDLPIFMGCPIKSCCHVCTVTFNWNRTHTPVSCVFIHSLNGGRWRPAFDDECPQHVLFWGNRTPRCSVSSCSSHSNHVILSEPVREDWLMLWIGQIQLRNGEIIQMTCSGQCDNTDPLDTADMQALLPERKYLKLTAPAAAAKNATLV